MIDWCPYLSQKSLNKRSKSLLLETSDCNRGWLLPTARVAHAMKLAASYPCNGDLRRMKPPIDFRISSNIVLCLARTRAYVVSIDILNIITYKLMINLPVVWLTYLDYDLQALEVFRRPNKSQLLLFVVCLKVFYSPSSTIDPDIWRSRIVHHTSVDQSYSLSNSSPMDSCMWRLYREGAKKEGDLEARRNPISVLPLRVWH